MERTRGMGGTDPPFRMYRVCIKRVMVRPDFDSDQISVPNAFRINSYMMKMERNLFFLILLWIFFR
jgi:hypothetical protein